MMGQQQDSTAPYLWKLATDGGGFAAAAGVITSVIDTSDASKLTARTLEEMELQQQSSDSEPPSCSTSFAQALPSQLPACCSEGLAMLAAVFSSNGGVTDGSRADGASSPPTPPRSGSNGAAASKATCSGLAEGAKPPLHGEARPSANRSLVSKMLQRRLRPLPPVVGIRAPAAAAVELQAGSGTEHLGVDGGPPMTGVPSATASEPYGSQLTGSRMVEPVATALRDHAVPDGGTGSGDHNNNQNSSCSLASVGAASLSQSCPMVTDDPQGLQLPRAPHPLPDEVMSAFAQKVPLPFRHQPSEALLLESLRSWRLARARQAGKQPSGVLPDQVLGAVAARSPLTYPDLLQVPGLTPIKAQQLGQELLDLVRMQQARSTSRGQAPMLPLPLLPQMAAVTGGGPPAVAGKEEVGLAVQQPLAKLGSASSNGSSSSCSIKVTGLDGDAPAAAGAAREEGDGDNHRPAPAVEFDIDAFFAAPAAAPPLPPPPPPLPPLPSETAAAPAPHRDLGRGKMLVVEPQPLEDGAHLGGHKRERPCGSSKAPSSKRAKVPPLATAATCAVPKGKLEVPPTASPRPAFDEAAFFSAPGAAVVRSPNPLPASRLPARYPGMSQLPAAAAAAPPVPPLPRRKAVRTAKSSRGSPAAAAVAASQDGDGGGGGSGRFLERKSDAALKQYSREEDRWILDQVASGIPEGEVAVTLRRSRNAIVRRVRLLIARATGGGTAGGGGGGAGSSSRGIGGTPPRLAPWPHHSRSKGAASTRVGANKTPLPSAVAADAAGATSASEDKAAPAVPPGELLVASAAKDGAAPATAGGSTGGVPPALGTVSAANEPAVAPPSPPAIDPSEAAAVRAILSARAAAAVARSTTSLPQHLLDPLIECIRMGSVSSASSAGVARAQADSELPGDFV